jgi:hypothetical protein
MYCLRNNADSASDYIAWNERQINEKWPGRDMEGRAPSFILELLWHLCGVKENKKTLSKESLSLDLDLNSGPPE